MIIEVLKREHKGTFQNSGNVSSDLDGGYTNIER